MKLIQGINLDGDKFSLDLLFGEDNRAVAMVYGISNNLNLSQMDERDTAGMKNAKEIISAVNGRADLIDALAEFTQRCNKAVEELAKLPVFKNKEELWRIKGKIEGVQLAQEYAKTLFAALKEASHE